MSTRTCQICGQEKPAEAFSKSYPNRCRECVAEAARDKRKAGKKFNGIETPLVIIDEPTYTTTPQTEPDWERRRYDLALALFHAFLGPEPGLFGTTPAQAALAAKEAADAFINTMREDNNEEEIS